MFILRILRSETSVRTRYLAPLRPTAGVQVQIWVTSEFRNEKFCNIFRSIFSPY